MTYLRLYETDDGVSHFSEVEVSFAPVEFIPGKPPLNLSPSTAAVDLTFTSIPLGWDGDWHPTPRRQFWCTLAGEAIVTAGDGEERHFVPGTMVLLEDLGGQGHNTRVIGDGPFVGVLIALPG
jgi:hypothetical protein